MSVVQTEWRFDMKGTPLATHRIDEAAMRVRAVTQSEAIARTETLRPQLEALLSRSLAAMSDAPVTATHLTATIFEPSPLDQGDEERLEKHSVVFLAYWTTDKLESRILGFARVYQDPQLRALVSTALVADLALSEQQREAVQRALFHTTQSVGETLTLELLTTKRAKAALSDAKSESAPTSQGFYRSLFMESDFAKKLLTEHAFVDELDRLEMRKDVTPVDASEPVFPDDVEIKSLDLSDLASLKQFYNVLKMAFDPSAPTFEAWAIHYPQQPRFAPELSFAAWSKATNEPVAVVAIERIVAGEGGGDDEVNAVFVTSAKLLAHVQRMGTDGADADPASSPALAFAADYDEKKAAIAQQATVAYVCGAATKAEYRGKGLSSSLLRHAFRVAAAKSPLREITLGTDAANTSAVRAYQRAGMVVTKTFSTGSFVVKHVSLSS